MRYEEKSGRITLSLDELISVSLCRLASERAEDSEQLRPRPLTGEERERYVNGEAHQLSYEFTESGHRFLLLCEADEWKADGFTLLRRLPCDPTIPPKDILRRLRGEAFALAHLFFLEHPEEKSVKATFLRFGAQVSAPVRCEEEIGRADAAKFFARLCA